MQFARSTISIAAFSVASSGAFVLPDKFMKSGKRSADRSRLHKLPKDLHEFDFLLNEQSSAPTDPTRSITRRVVLPESSIARVTMTSAVSPTDTSNVEGDALDGDVEMDSFKGEDVTQQVEAIGKQRRMTYQEYEGRVREDTDASVTTINDIIVGSLLPMALAFLFIRSIIRRTSRRYNKSKDEVLDSFTEDMMYNDGDVEGLRQCKKEYATKLLFLGPARDDIMLKRYIEAFALRKSVTPEALSSMSYVISLFGLSEVQFAKAVVGVCRDLGEEDKASTTGKLLFFGNRILKSPEGLNALAPARNILKVAYSGGGLDGDIMIETSETAMAESGYRATIEAKGENQSMLPSGWEILGLTKERAEEIFEEEREGGFTNVVEAEVADRLVKYSDSGEPLDEFGNVIRPEGAEGGVAMTEESSQGQIMECQNCGFTIFIAPGRDHKFFGADFTCPECGAGKDQMKASQVSEDDL